MVNNTQVERIGGKGVKAGRGPIAAGVLAVIAAGTFIGVNLVNDDEFAGVCATHRCLSVIDATSTTETGATTNALFLPSPFDADAPSRGYKTGTGISMSTLIEVVANPTGANFDCYIGAADAGTGTVALIQNLTATGTKVLFMSGHTLGPNHGYGCNTTDRITSATLLKAGGVFFRSDLLN